MPYACSTLDLTSSLRFDGLGEPRLYEGKVDPAREMKMQRGTQGPETIVDRFAPEIDSREADFGQTVAAEACLAPSVSNRAIVPVY